MRRLLTITIRAMWAVLKQSRLDSYTSFYQSAGRDEDDEVATLLLSGYSLTKNGRIVDGERAAPEN